jgi:hypothetical protein
MCMAKRLGLTDQPRSTDDQTPYEHWNMSIWLKLLFKYSNDNRSSPAFLASCNALVGERLLTLTSPTPGRGIVITQPDYDDG